MNLNEKQQAALDHVSNTDLRWRDAKLTAKKRAEELVRQEMAAFSQARDMAVYEAIKLDVPKRRVGQDGLHTTSPNVVTEIFERVARVQEDLGVELAVKPAERYQWSEDSVAVGGVTFSWVIDSQNYHLTPELELPEGTIPAHEGYRFGHTAEGWTTPSAVPIGVAVWAQENPR